MAKIFNKKGSVALESVMTIAMITFVILSSWVTITNNIRDSLLSATISKQIKKEPGITKGHGGRRRPLSTHD